MDDQNFSLKGVIQKVKEYIKTWKELSRLVLVEKISSMLAGLIVDILLVILALLVFFFLSVSLAYYLGGLLGSYSLGFLITSGIYLLIIVILILLKTRIEDTLINLSIKKFLKKWKESDED